MCTDRTDVLDALDAVLQGRPGGKNNPLGLGGKTGKTVDNLYIIQNDKQSNAPAGTSTDAGLRKLRKYAASHPEIAQLRQLVLAGEMSVHRALVNAGLRKKPLHLTRCARRPVTQDAGRCLFPHEPYTTEGFVLGIPDRRTDVKKIYLS